MNAHETRVKREEQPPGMAAPGMAAPLRDLARPRLRKTLLKRGASGPEPGRACARVHVRSRECADENQEHECL